MIMSTYDEIASGLRKYAERIGGKANLMRFLDAKKATIYRALDDEDPALPAPDVLCEWLDKINAQVSFPGEELDDYVMIPKVKAVAGAGASLETNGDVAGFYAFRNEFLKREHINGKNSVMMVVRGDSMEPLIKEGDTILIDQNDKTPQDGRIFLVGLGEELMVKVLQKIPNGWNICSINERYAPLSVQGDEMETFRVYGRVRWFGRVL
ncbi:S24 family peptidase [uncultured Desulfovibrio sp.]|jgi:phage repressor protein C with HTH and peptisase S24 domain|uniref:S24 family peptidase n=1 Tax=uncultured Desulfovibrio sp. TaxID=167968 RepID=UPI0028054E52|nr:S24 family peptidase [uncultured Desulfovibrio sp.]